MPKKISNITLTFLSSLMLSTSLYAVGGENLMMKSDDEEEAGIKSLHTIQKLKANATVIDLANFNSTQGFVIQGAKEWGHSGSSVSYAGDINVDGINDVIVGAWGANNGAGASYVIYGRKGGYPGPLDLANLNPTQGFVIQGADQDNWTGASVKNAGDINADGIDDVIIEAFGANNYAGASYVIYGRKGGYPGPIDLANLNLTQGFIIQGAAQGNPNSDSSVSYAGDINVDGIDDVIIGAWVANNATGASYVIYGRKGGYPDPIDLANLSSTQGFVIQGAAQGGYSGHSVSNAGDINADGIDDVIVGGSQVNNYAGASYVIYGRKGGYPDSIDLANLSSTQGFVIQGAAQNDDSGTSVSYAGDINADSIDDVVVGAWGANNGAGASYVIYGRKGGYPDSIDLANLSSMQGFVIQGAAQNDGSGSSVSYAGDINADGIDDVIVGAYQANNYAGASYVIYGRKGGYPGPLDLANLSSAQGLVIQGAAQSDWSGWSVHYAGDINVDGIDDVIVGASGVNNSAGASYVIYGNKSFSHMDPFPWKAKEVVKIQPLRIGEAHNKKATPKEKAVKALNNPFRLQEKQKVQVAEAEEDLHNITASTSDGISSHQIPWYSPAKWVKAFQSLWCQPESEETTLMSEAHALLKMKSQSERLISQADENPDKWYRYSLEDLVESLDESLKNPETIHEETLVSFEKRLQGIMRDFHPGNAQQSKLTFFTELESSASLLPQERAFELLSISSTPVLGSGTIPLALGN